MTDGEKTMLINKEIATPLYSQIKSLILQSIVTGEFKTGDKIPSEMELAAIYGVSRITTKQALNELMQEGVVCRVAGKGTFVKAQEEKNDITLGVSGLREISEEFTGKTPGLSQAAKTKMTSVGLILPYLNDTFEMGLISGVEQELRKQDCHLIIRKSGNSPEEESRAIDALRTEGVQGLIMLPIEGMFCSESLLKLKLDKFPFVLVDRFYRGIDTNYVVSDNYGGAYAAGKHLVELGHCHVGLVGYSPESVLSIYYRIKGFCQALADAEIPLPAARMELSLEREQVYNHNTGRPDQLAIATIQRFLGENPKMTAIFGINDYTAVCILRAALAMGLRVPDDLSIIGFDNNLLAANVEVPLTTVNQPKRGIGKCAAQLLKRIYENDGQATEGIVLPTELIVRMSTAAPVKSKARIRQ